MLLQMACEMSIIWVCINNVVNNQRLLEYVLKENTILLCFCFNIIMFNFRCYLPFICYYLWNVLAISEWKQFQSKSYTIYFSDFFYPTLINSQQQVGWLP